MNLRLIRFFDEHIVAANAEAKIFLEAGCGGSQWLPFFAQRYGYRLLGLDYSQKGCKLSQRILEQAGITGEILMEDVFSPSARIHECADVVYSFGMVEHFLPTESIVQQLCGLLRPGGKMITIIPNMQGLQGLLQRLVDRDVYDAHVPLSVSELREAHERCGLDVLDARFLGTLSLGTVNAERLAGTWMYRVFRELVFRSGNIVWKKEQRGMKEKPSRIFSPLLACVARKS